MISSGAATTTSASSLGRLPVVSCNAMKSSPKSAKRLKREERASGGAISRAVDASLYVLNRGAFALVD